MRTVVTGGTGLIGRALLRRLPEPAVVFSRADRSAAGAVGVGEVVRWDPLGGPPPPQALRGAEVVFNLMGEPAADGRWTAEKKRRIRDSRVVGTRNLVAGLAALDKRPRVLVSASAVGYYGDRGDELLDERSARGEGFLADVCVEWEREAMAAERLGIRVVCVRIGLVMSTAGGALAKMLPPFRLGAGGRLGNGRQWMPWIHIDDLVGVLLHAATTEAVQGPINGVAPAPATNAAFTLALARAVRRPAMLPMPAFALNVAFGEMAGMLMASQRVMPALALRSGYAFSHPDLDGALASLLAPEARRVAA
jgi:uncharacterized protein (TIGR01777 family)